MTGQRHLRWWFSTRRRCAPSISKGVVREALLVYMRITVRSCVRRLIFREHARARHSLTQVSAMILVAATHTTGKNCGVGSAHLQSCSGGERSSRLASRTTTKSSTCQQRCKSMLTTLASQQSRILIVPLRWRWSWRKTEGPLEAGSRWKKAR